MGEADGRSVVRWLGGRCVGVKVCRWVGASVRGLAQAVVGGRSELGWEGRMAARARFGGVATGIREKGSSGGDVAGALGRVRLGKGM